MQADNNILISELAVSKKFLGQIVSYPASLVSISHSLECYAVI